ncbi:hypothetical protein JAAARDRAFT_439388 [Jaapia argillacea MUCL 33604]|uniref:Uncharacterized protein n=1 Tax=Jaapia argillacea MUCL 33604 TaxID=933084 RepID=A0A067PPN9_9AGAM|nr:hypothetical protein JAAARDRAFT_439388 [Jaapia argillacea MUCL 33604]
MTAPTAPRKSVLKLFDPLNSPAPHTPRRKPSSPIPPVPPLPAMLSEKENDLPAVRDEAGLKEGGIRKDEEKPKLITMSAFFNRTYESSVDGVGKKVDSPRTPRGRLVDVTLADAYGGPESDEEDEGGEIVEFCGHSDDECSHASGEDVTPLATPPHPDVPFQTPSTRRTPLHDQTVIPKRLYKRDHPPLPPQDPIIITCPPSDCDSHQQDFTTLSTSHLTPSQLATHSSSNLITHSNLSSSTTFLIPSSHSNLILNTSLSSLKAVSNRPSTDPSEVALPLSPCDFPLPDSPREGCAPVWVKEVKTPPALIKEKTPSPHISATKHTPPVSTNKNTRRPRSSTSALTPSPSLSLKTRERSSSSATIQQTPKATPSIVEKLGLQAPPSSQSSSRSNSHLRVRNALPSHSRTQNRTSLDLSSLDLHMNPETSFDLLNDKISFLAGLGEVSFDLEEEERGLEGLVEELGLVKEAEREIREKRERERELVERKMKEEEMGEFVGVEQSLGAQLPTVKTPENKSEKGKDGSESSSYCLLSHVRSSFLSVFVARFF